MASRQAHLRLGRTVGAQFVGDQHLGCKALFLEQLAHELRGCPLVAPSLHQQIENLAFVVDRPPQPELLAADQDGHLASRAGDSHPHALPEPYVTLSSHTAPDVRPFAKRLCLGHRAPPVTGWLWVAAEQCSPFDPAPLQNLPLYYELLRPCAPHRSSDPCGSSRSDVSLCIGATGSHVPYKSLIRLRAAYVPDVARAVFRPAPELFPGPRRLPGFDIAYGISTLHQRFACARLSGSHLTGSCPAFFCNAHHDRS